MLRVGILGAGFISSVYRKAIQRDPEALLTRVADCDRFALALFPLAATSTETAAVIEAEDVDLVCVLTPHDSHARLVTQALEAGKHVLCEKPLALTLEETDRLMALARRKERHLLCRQYMRRAGFAVQIKQLIREGALGRVRSVKIDYVTQQLSSLEDPNGWRGSWSRAGGGVVMDLAIHPIDLLREIFGAGQVQASVCRRLCVTGRDRAEDFAVLLLEHSDGPIAQISLMNCDSVDQAPRFHWEFIGERGRVMVEGSWASANLAEIGPSLGRKSNFPQWWDAANQQSVLEAFDRVRKCAPSGESASEFRQNLATILDAYEWAAKEGAPGSAS